MLRLLLFFILCSTFMAQNVDFTRNFDSFYHSLKNTSIFLPYIDHKAVVKNILALQKLEDVKTEIIGKSFENKDIYLISIGSGQKKIFMWSQMHGDEPTATASLFDFFNIFTTKDSGIKQIADQIKKSFTIYIIPMLNPDGAARFTRRNAQDIDLNRDVVKQNTPETKLLIEYFHKIKPDFCFNLHDQSTLYSVGNSPRQVIFSFLAPPVDFEKSIPQNRAKAIQLISELHDNLASTIPGHMARYNDEFEPRAIGDYFQSQGAPTVLIECGGLKTDPNKEIIRKLHTFILLKALTIIASDQYQNETFDTYFEIPENDRRLYDVILRNVYFAEDKKNVDIGINFSYLYNPKLKKTTFEGRIEEISDLTGFYGLSEFNVDGLKIQPDIPPEFENHLQSTEELLSYYSSEEHHLLKDSVLSNEEINLFPVIKKRTNKVTSMKRGSRASFSLWNNGKPKYLVIDGLLINISGEPHRCTGNIPIN